MITEEWAVIAQDWASIVGVSGREFIATSAEQSETTYRVTMRYRPDLDTSMRWCLPASAPYCPTTAARR
ncbi:phage head closure protein [Billgrantia montanilacus]|uniref:phage head closure protein n=1 Tax=Billgrantia montanilacus TaxID=2282305 RepID=UPI003BEED9A8